MGYSETIGASSFEKKNLDNNSENFSSWLNSKREDLFNILSLNSKSEFNSFSKIEYSIDSKVLCIESLNSDSVEENKRALSKLIIENDIKKVKLSDNINGNQRRIIYEIISENYPLIDVVRLMPGSKVVNLNISGVKKLNDTLSSKFVDSLNNTFLNILLENIGKNETTRLVRSNYKNITFSMDVENLEENLFGKFNSKVQIIEEIIRRLEKNSSLEKLSSQKGKSINEIKNMILKYYNFGIGFSEVPSSADDKSKLTSFYQSEIQSRQSIEQENLEAFEYDINEIIDLSQEVVEMKNNVIEKWEGQVFKFESTEYDIIKKEGSNKFINPILLRYARKYDVEENKIFPKELHEEVQNYLNYLNSGFDFVAPLLDYHSSFENAKDIDIQVGKGEIDASYFLKNYKGSYTKDSFFEAIGNKQGTRIFVDIKDMGIMNLTEFKKLSEKVNSGNFSKEDLFKAGDNVTVKFLKLQQNLLDRLGQNYENVFLSLGGDELFLFVEGSGSREIQDIIDSINKSFGKNMEGRISYTFDTSIDSSKSYDILDEKAKISKFFEENIERVLTETNLDKKIKMPRSISIESGDEIINDLDYLSNSIKYDDIKVAIGHLANNGQREVKVGHRKIRINGKLYDIYLEKQFGNYMKIKFM